MVWKSVNYGKINALGMEAMTEFDFRKLLPEQRVLRRLNVSYCFINQDQHEGEGVRSLYALEYLKNKVVTTLGLNLWRQLTLDLSYRFQHRMGHYNDLQGQLHSYGSYGILRASSTAMAATASLTQTLPGRLRTTPYTSKATISLTATLSMSAMCRNPARGSWGA